MKKLKLILLLSAAFHFQSLHSQTIQLLPSFHNITDVELDRFIYCEESSGALYYDFRVRHSGSGLDTIISGHSSYFSLNALFDSHRHFSTTYTVSTRYGIPGHVSDWGIPSSVSTVAAPAYSYGKVRVKFSNSEYIRYADFSLPDSLVHNSSIPGFNELSAAAGIYEMSYPARKIMELTGNNPYSLIDFSFDKSFSVDSLISFFNSTGYVEFAEPHYAYHLSAAPSEYTGTMANTLWHLGDINAEGAWELLGDGTGNNIIIAVVDNVFDIDHEDLRSNIYVNIGELPSGFISDSNGNGTIDADDLLAYYRPRGYSTLRELFLNPPSDAIFNGTDDDRNGYPDDLCGWNLANNNNKVVPAHYNGSYLSHGTHVAGIAGAVSNNGGIASLSNNHAMILPLKLSYDETDYHASNISSPLSALEYILSLHEKPHIISMSFAGTEIEYFRESLSILEEHSGVLSVAATGNESTRNRTLFPAYYDNVIAVGSTNRAGNMSDFSNYGEIPGTYVLSPGEGIYSTICDESPGDSYSFQDGTSLSTPLVSALASLLYSYNPRLQPAAARRAIECGCVPFNNYSPSDHGYGKADAYRSLLCLQGMPPEAHIIMNNDFFCPSGEYYTFSGTSLTTLEDCRYAWSISGGQHEIYGSNSEQELMVRFLETGTYTVLLQVSSQSGTSTVSTEIEVLHPSATILNGSEFESCTGYNTDIHLRLEGSPPFTIAYSFGGVPSTVTAESRNYVISLETALLTPGERHTFRIESLYDSYGCSGAASEAVFTIAECLNSCSGKYNQIMHFNIRHLPVDTISMLGHGIYFNPDIEHARIPFNLVTASLEGTASISDASGNPILSASGGYLYPTSDSCFGQIINSEPIAPYDISSSTQGHLILPDVQNPDRYYVLTVGQQSTIDAKITLGAVDFSEAECGEYTALQEFYNNDNEKLAACRISGAEGYWIVTHSSGSHTFNIYRLMDSEGVLVEEQRISFSNILYDLDLGEMKFNLQMNMLAVAFGLSKTVELYRFNPDIGFSGDRLEQIGYRNNNGFVVSYSLEFSPEGRFLYVLDFENVFQYPVDNFATAQPYTVNYYSRVSYTGITLGPDMKIYMGGRLEGIGMIASPDNAGIACNYILSHFSPISVQYNFPPRVPIIPQTMFFIEGRRSGCSYSLGIANSGISEPAAFLWSTGEDTPEIIISDTGTYTVSVTFRNGCSVSKSIHVGEDDIYRNPEISVYRSHNPCAGSGESTGYISAGAEGGERPYTYKWLDEYDNAVSYSPDFYNIPIGSYRLIAYDANGCSASLEHSVYYVHPPAVDIISVQHTCSRRSYGSAEASVEGWDVYDYRWSNGETTRVAENLTPGTHYVTVTDGNGCYSTDSVEILQFEAIAKIGVSKECIYAGDGSLYFYPGAVPEEDSHMYNFLWEASGGETSTDYRFFPQLRSEGYYCVKLTVYNESCSGTESITAYVYPGSCYCDMEFDYDNIKIEDSRTWSGASYTISGTLKIAPGASLNLINTTLKFGPGGKIIVEPGGYLACEKSVLSSLGKDGCNDMWQGIEVHGSPYNGTSDPQHHGLLKIVEGTEISNAHIGILLGERNYGCICDNMERTPTTFFVEPSGGGMLEANTSGRVRCTLVNNGIHIKSLRKAVNGTFIYVHNTDFVCKGKLLDKRYNSGIAGYFTPRGTNPWMSIASNRLQRTRHAIDIEASLVADIRLCTFNNAETGIFSIDTRHYIDKCEFVNAIYGIYLNNSTTNHRRSNTIGGCIFDSIPVAQERIMNPQLPQPPRYSHIYIAAGVGDEIKDNTFGERVRPLDISSYGISLNNCSGFKIIENYFNNLPVAVHVDNSGAGGGYIGAGNSNTNIHWKGNAYYNCNSNIVTVNDNQKLELKCNMCDNNIDESFISNIESHGVLYDQGSPIIYTSPGTSLYRNRETYGAGNEFRGDVLTVSPKLIKSRTTTNYGYYHHNNYETTPTLSALPEERMVNLHNLNIAKTTNAVACNSDSRVIISFPGSAVINRIPGRFTLGEIQGKLVPVLDSIAYIIKSIESGMEKISNNYDNGNTEILLKEIVNSKDPYKLKALLDNHYPLSDTVLIELAANYPLTDEGFYDIMVQSSPVSSAVWEYLYKRLEYIPAKYSSAIAALQTDNPHAKNKTYTMLKKEKEYWDVKRGIYLHDILFLLSDSLNNGTETAMNILKAENNNYSKQLLISSYILEGSFGNAHKVFISFNPADEQEEDWVEYYEFLEGLDNSKRSLYSLDSTELEFLRKIAGRCPAGKAAANAQSVLAYYYNEFTAECEDVQASSKGEKEIVLNFDKKNAAVPYIGDNYPDPFSEETGIDYYVPEGDYGKIIIIDMLGRKIGEYGIEDGENTLMINSSGWNQGVYYYGLIVNEKPVEYKKMVLTR